MNHYSFALFVFFIFGGMSIHLSAQICHPDDYNALTRLRDATNGGGGIGSWNTITNLPNGLTSRWTGPSTAPVYQWYGIDTIHDTTFPVYYRVSKINLDGSNFLLGNRLENVLPDSLFVASSLEQLDTFILSNNNLVGTSGLIKTLLPTTNHQLKYLELNNNSFLNNNANVFVDLLSNFINLEEVLMNSAMATTPTAFTFYNIPSSNSLQKINLALNTFSDTLRLDALLDIQWPNLTYLAMNDNFLTAIDVPVAATGGSLSILDLNNNNIIRFQDVANCLERLNALTIFNGSSVMNELIGANLMVTNTFAPNLSKINLSNNGLIGSLPLPFFEDIPALQFLDLSNNSLGGTLPKPRAALASGVFAGIIAYANTSNLIYLGLASNNFSGKVSLDWLFLSQLNTNTANGGLAIPLQAFNVSNNHFNEVIPDLSKPQVSTILSSFNNRFQNMNVLNVEANRLDFKDLFRLKRFFRLKQVTILLNDHYIPQSGSNPNDFKYSLQDSIGIGGVKRRNAGDSLIIEAGRNVIEPESGTLNVLKNKYTWERIGLTGTPIQIGIVNPNGTFSAGPGVHSSYAGALGLLGDSTHSHQLGIYHLDDTIHHLRHFTACVTNDSFPLLTICMKQKLIQVGLCKDDVGRPIECQTMVVQYNADTLAQYTPQQQDSVKQASSESIGATPIATCVCGELELWEISDTSTTMVEGNGLGTKNSSSSVSAKPELLSAEPNYSLMASSSTPLPDTVALPAGSGNTTSTTLVAIIDSGFDYSYTGLVPHVSEGASQNTSCMQNAVWGYNFLDDNNNASDDHGHGTAIAGIVAGMSQQNLLPDTGSTAGSIGILPLKYTNKYGEGTVFHAACGMYYAADYARSISGGQTARVRVINNSWGYYGEPSEILENTIKYVGNDCGILVICSAGNDSLMVQGFDSLMHWPSNSLYDPLDTSTVDNILSVTSINNHNSNTLSPYSNYGDIFIDIAAQGTDNTTQAGSVNGFVSVNGTSFSTAQVSRAAALLFNKYPDATYHAVKFALLSSVDKLQSIDSLKISSDGRLNFQRADSILNTLTDRTICTDYFSAIHQLPQTDVNQEVKLYPNPVSNTLNIEFDSKLTQKETTLQIINVQGQLLTQQAIFPNTILALVETENLPKGIYFVHILTDNKQIVKKFVKL